MHKQDAEARTDLEGSVGVGCLGPAGRQDTAVLAQLAPPDMLTGVGADGASSRV